VIVRIEFGLVQIGAIAGLAEGREPSLDRHLDRLRRRPPADLQGGHISGVVMLDPALLRARRVADHPPQHGDAALPVGPIADLVQRLLVQAEQP